MFKFEIAKDIFWQNFIENKTTILQDYSNIKL